MPKSSNQRTSKDSSNPAEVKIRDDFKLERNRDKKYNTSGNPVYTLIEYLGSETDIVIPDDVVNIKGFPFKDKEVQSLTLSKSITLRDLQSMGEMMSLKRIVSTANHHDEIDCSLLNQKFPALETLEFRNASPIYISCMDTLSEMEHPFEIRVMRYGAILFVRGKYMYCPDFVLFTPNITPGHILPPLCLNALNGFFTHPEWYSEKNAKSYKGWVSRNIEKLINFCTEYKAETLLMKCLTVEGMKLPAKVYDRLISSAEEARNQEIVAAALHQKEKYYDLAKLAKREETLALNDMMDPLRIHAMKQIWSWGKVGEDALVLKKYKGGQNNGVPVKIEDVDIPSEIAGKPVTTLSGHVFKDTRIKSVVIPESITDLYGGIFASTPVKEVRFEGRIRGIPDRCFMDCAALSSVRCFGDSLVISPSEMEIPDAIPGPYPFVVGWGAFDNSGIRHAWVQNAILSQKAFHYSDLRTITLRNVQVIPYQCFADCMDLTSVDMRDCVVIDYQAFDNCSSLKDIHVSDALYSVSTVAFEHCQSLRCIHLHGVKSPERIQNLFPQAIKKSVEFILEE